MIVENTTKDGEDLAVTSTAGGFRFKDKMSFKDAVMEEAAIKRNVVRAANHVTELSAMAMNRHERRRLAKVNKVGRIYGSTRPYTNQINVG